MENNTINRRKFIRMSAVAGAGAAFLSEGAKASVVSKPVQSVMQEQVEIPVHTLGRTGLKIPVLSMGVMKADNPNVLRAAFNSGIRHFDTANGYQNGKNEEMLGEFFADKPRDSYYVATKARIDYPLRENSEKEFMERVDTSLERLKLKYVDIFYIHDIRTVEMLSDERIIAAIKKVKESGKARFIGFSTHANIPAVIEGASKLDVYDVILHSYNFKMNDLNELNASLESAAKSGIGLVVMKAMTGGVQDAAGKTKVNAQACLKWVWQNKNIATIIPGFTNYDELDECFAAVKTPNINDDEKKYLASLRDSQMMFCQQCGECKGQCPQNLPIPDLMRAYMYTYGYKYAQLSKETLAELSLPDDTCSNCNGNCRVKCPSGFNVGEKIAAIMPVKDIPDVFLT